MATVASVMSAHSLSDYEDMYIGGRHIRHYTNPNYNRSQAQVKTCSGDLQADVDSSTVILGGSEPDVVMMQSAVNQTILVK